MPRGRTPRKKTKSPKKMSGVTVTQRGVRDTARGLKTAMSTLQAAAKNARKKLSDESAAILAEKSDDLHREIKEAEMILRRANESGLTTKNLEEVINKARETITDSDEEIAQRMEDTEAEKESEEGSGRGKGSKKGERRERTREGESENETIDEWPSKRSSAKSKATNALEDTRLRERAQEKELEALMVAIEAKKKELEKTREVAAIHAERVERASGKSGCTSRRSDFEEEEDEQEAREQRKNKEKQREKNKGKKTDKEKEREKGRRNKGGEQEEEETSEEENEEEEQNATPIGARTPPKKNRMRKWVEEAKRETGKKKDKKPREEKSVIEELSQATAAVLRQQMLQSRNATGTSVLEGIKIMERRRPSEKFTGEDKKIDFEDQLAQFKKAIDLPGLPASYKVAELPHWFGGLARVHISKYLRRDDHEKALEEAIEKLEYEHGNKATTAEEMLEELLKGKTIENNDAVGMNMAISKLEEAFFLAVETDRDADFNRKSLFRTILSNMFPHLRNRWATEVAKAQTRGKTMDKFEDFLAFLTVQKKAACEIEQLEVETKRTTREHRNERTNEEGRKPKTQSRKPEAERNTDDEGFTRVERKPRQTNTDKECYNCNRTGHLARDCDRRPQEPTRRTYTPQHDCDLCKERHWIQACSQFRDKNTNDRLEHLEKHNLCLRCLRWPHKVETCNFEGKCAVCGSARHHTMIHGATKLELWEKNTKEEETSNA